ncbi:unnamed protein product [Darwinula stevensoni]|uniref:G domain-containing protein n=1 Tax=Darwinula stevensoni TaxID=69355 RepID=A0A7R8X9N2_9CRUS|nr:unnamed protein product [Darwinula stevensoni]CAG0889139.1 unnamed protein product [Darwinula stevensoni]
MTNHVDTSTPKHSVPFARPLRPARNQFKPREDPTGDITPKAAPQKKVNEGTGDGEPKDPPEITTPRKEETLAQRMKKTCKNIDGFIYELPKNGIMKDQPNKLAKVEIGDRGPTSAAGSGKVLMLVGGTGAGKSTLINSMANYVYGVKLEDDFRFKLIVDEGRKPSVKSQTKWITAYVLHHQPGYAFPCTLTLIDTPGFDDTEGLQEDEKLRDQLRKLFSQGGNIGVDQLDGVCFVVQASQARLTTSQKYIYDAILAVLGKDIEKIIYVLTTFSDFQNPPVLATVREAGIPYKKHFEVNNQAIFVKSDDEPNELVKCFWSMGYRSFKKLFKVIIHAEPVSLTLTKEVLQQRKHLEAALQGILPQINTATGRLEQLRETYAALRQHEAEMNANKNFRYTVKVVKRMKVDLDVGTYATNCLTCNMTCHFPCSVENDKDKNTCSAMHTVGTITCCQICPWKCAWDEHVNSKYRFKIYVEDEMHTFTNLQKRYEAAVGKRLSTKDVLNTLIKDFNQERAKVYEHTKKAHECLQILDQIALKPNPLSILEYIDLLINNEERQGNAECIQRMKYLEDAKRKVELAKKLKENFDPFEACMKEFTELGMDISVFDPHPD